MERKGTMGIVRGLETARGPEHDDPDAPFAPDGIRLERP